MLNSQQNSTFAYKNSSTYEKGKALYEEAIIRLHQNKRSMADALLQDAHMFSQISADDVIKLLKEGVDAL